MNPASGYETNTPSESHVNGGIGSAEHFRQSLIGLEGATNEFQQQTTFRGVLEPASRYKGSAVAPYLDRRRLDENHLRAQVIQAANAQEFFIQEAQSTVTSSIEWRAHARTAVRNAWIQTIAGLVGATVLIAILIAI